MANRFIEALAKWYGFGKADQEELARSLSEATQLTGELTLKINRLALELETQKEELKNLRAQNATLQQENENLRR
jgi:predicted nuclease with TOPRIM domain